MALDWQTFGQAIGLAMLMEGVIYFCFAERMPGVLLQLAHSPPAVLRILGGVAMGLGLVIVFLFHSG